jgi:hypothetical protein
MAEKYSFVQGVFGNEFLQLKTTDNIYLKDLLEQTIFPSLEAYNQSVEALSNILCYKFIDKIANQKKLFADNQFAEISELEVPPVKSTLDSWNYPQPLRRLGSANKMTMEVIKQMDSKQIVAYQDSVYLSDRKEIIKTFFKNMMTKTPSARVDCLTSIPATPKAFWNADAADAPRKNGQMTFTTSHDHYILVDASGTTDADDLYELMGLVTEHSDLNNAQLILWIRKNSTELSQVKALTGYRAIEGLGALIGAINPNYGNTGIVQALVNGKKILGDSASIVGTYKEALVVESPDIPLYYIGCTASLGDNNINAPLGWRESPGFEGLQMVNPNGENPIIGHNAQFRRYMSGYVNNRDAGAVMLTSHSASWAEPTFI